MPVQLHQLSYAVAVAEERHFTRAAARLHLAQPSLSRQIRLLERELGVLLFNRGPGQALVTLTADGEALLPFIRRVLADVEAVAVEARALTGMAHGQLSIGATPSLITRVLAPALVEFHSSYPGIEFMLVEAGSRQLVRQLASGEVDLALVVLPIDDPLVSTTPLFDDPLVLAVAPDHPLARRRSVRVADLDGLPLIMFREGYDLRAVTLAACRDAGVAPRLVSQGGEMDGVLAMVAAGLGAAVVPAIAMPTESTLAAVPFVHPGLSRTVALAHRADRPVPLPARALVAQLGADHDVDRISDGDSGARRRVTRAGHRAGAAMKPISSTP